MVTHSRFYPSGSKQFANEGRLEAKARVLTSHFPGWNAYTYASNGHHQQRLLHFV